MGNLRNFIIDRFSSEATEKVVPDYESEWLKEEAILNSLHPIKCPSSP